MNDIETQSHLRLLAAVLLAGFLTGSAAAQESPYFVTYTHHMEEPGNLEVEFNPVLVTPKEGARSLASTLELEYGARGWWTTALYLDSTSSGGRSVFTGYRLENRFRLLMAEHVVNPVLYVEFASTSEADRISKEIVGFDAGSDLAEPLADIGHEREREVETKLILSSNRRGWNIAANAIAEKNLAGAPWEFGYAIATSRPLRLEATPTDCRLCRENFTLGVELYGGAGDARRTTFAETSHYVAPTVSWNLPHSMTLRFSPAWGLTANSSRSFIRFGVAYEVPFR